MAADLPAVPDDVEALKAALIAARAEAAAVGAELARACATAANDRSLIAHLKLEIEKLRRAIYGPRSEGAARLIEQLELQLEEAEADAAEEELAAEQKHSALVKAFERKRRRESRFPIICRASASSFPRRRLAGAAARLSCRSLARTSPRRWKSFRVNGR